MGFDKHHGDAKTPLPPSTYSRPTDNSAGKAKVFAGGKYWECQKNHAASPRKHAVDGCGEFMASREEGTIEALRCAACTCHRNFHRKERERGAALETPPPPNNLKHSPNDRIPAMKMQPGSPVAGTMPLTSGGGTRDEGDHMLNPASNSIGGVASGSGKKRFRTKFSQEQKDKMLVFAERVGWRIRKQDETMVQELCQEARVTRHMLQVWMQNNKLTLDAALHTKSLGKHAVDGCGEFMAAREEGTIDALRCTACTCHRNLHRKEAEGGAALETPPPPNNLKHSPNDGTPAVQPGSPVAGTMPLTSGGGTRDEGDHMLNPASNSIGGVASGSGKKRFRTKFRQEQKGKMLVFAERVGWRIRNQDEAMVQELCQEARVTRHMLQVWMQNNKLTLGKKP